MFFFNQPYICTKGTFKFLTCFGSCPNHRTECFYKDISYENLIKVRVIILFNEIAITPVITHATYLVSCCK